VADVQQVAAAAVQELDGLTPEAAVCTDPAHVALVAVRDGQIRAGDWVAVSGLGAIGLMCVQIARVSGAERVLAIDPVPMRRAVALELGADAAFDPAEEDVAVAIKEATERRGVDVVLETSGNDRAMHQAIRCIMQCGVVVAVGWSAGSGEGLELGDEFHLNRPTIVGSQAVWDNPDRDYPRWTEQRARAAAANLLRHGKITPQGILTPIVRLEEAPDLLQALLERPAEVAAVKIGIRLA
jgi:threonine dehydrogenase-like Zn-dependent dehydrogenase